MSDNPNTKIIEIDDLDTITNGTLQELATIKNPNQIGKVINLDDNNRVLSKITPLIMIVNQGCKDYKSRLEILEKNGGNLDMEINYYNQNISARTLAINYRNYYS